MARKTPGLNTSSMADISFLLLAFFLMVSDIKTDKGIARVLPKLNTEQNAEKEQTHKRDLFIVLVNHEDKILTCQNDAWSRCEIGELKDRAKNFLNSNRSDNPALPELVDSLLVKRDADGNITRTIGRFMVSKGIISLRCHNSTSYEKYFQVQNELTAAVNELRNELSMRKYGQSYDPDPNKKSPQKEAVEMAIPMRISEAKPSNINVGGSN